MGSTADRAESSSSSSPIFNWSYDVFLSFRGEDTRSNFTGHLHMFLRHKGVNVFIDDRLERGEQISETLLKTIQNSLISIVIFSENYASSTWCLDELVEIIECKKSKGQKVLPIFYKVDPSDVRKQNGCYGEGLAKHEANFMEKIPIWRNALTTAANFSGWDLRTIRKEADLIQVIVKEVLYTLNVTTPSNVDEHLLVGIDSQSFYWPTEEMYKSESVDMLGIYGIGGIGKTTLAKALYYKMASQFEGCCFLSNVREASKQFNGLAQLQKKLLFQILNYDLEDVDDLDRGINIIKNRLRLKKVLILLDDVDEMKQLNALVGGHDWFGPGSKIIVTTRDKHLLDRHGFGNTYEVQGLWEDNAFELFCWHAFKKSHPSSNYLDLSKRATRYCKGHPLALVVLGSFLCGRDQAEWSGILDGFENSLRKPIKDVLQLSFNGLEDQVKEIFLDISCLLPGERVTYVKKMLSEFHSILDFGITKLMDLSLITFEEYDDRVQMHDLIKQMGQKIVEDESGDEPGKRSRLWLEKDILEVFSNNSGSDAVKGLRLVLSDPTRVIYLNPEAFRSMKNLRLLIVDGNVRFCKKIKYVPNGLKWIKWHRFPHRTVPSCFFTKDLVGLDLQQSLITHFGKGLQNCRRLKLINLINCPNLKTIPKSFLSLPKLLTLNLHHCLNLKKIPSSYISWPSLENFHLSHCQKFEKIPDFSSALNLKSLSLFQCTKLRMIHDSIGSLSKLVTLDLRECSNLEKLPSYLSWKSLEDLDLSYCKKLEEIPDFSSALNLKRLYLEQCTNLRVIHESIGSLNSLVTLDLRECSNLEKLPSYLSWKSLQNLNLSYCKKLEEIPDFSSAVNLQNLSLVQCVNLRMIHDSIGSLSELRTLAPVECSSLEKLPNYLSWKSLQNLYLSYCKKLEEISDFSSAVNLQKLSLVQCVNLRMIHDSIGSLSELVELDLSECSNLEKLPSYLSWKSLQNLNLSYCKKLEEIPDFSSAVNLQNLSLVQCVNLRMIHDSIGSLSELVELDLRECSNLEKLPSYLSWKSLQNLYLSYCKKLEEIPDFSSAVNLQYLSLEQCTKLRMIHDSIGSLSELFDLNLPECSNLEKLPSYLKLKSLAHLDLSGCRKLETFPEIDENMKSLEVLKLSYTAIRELPSSIGHLTDLQILDLKGCTNLISLPCTAHLFKSLNELSLSECFRFEMRSYIWDPTINSECSSSKIMKTSSTSEFFHSRIPKESLCFKYFCTLDLEGCNISNVNFLEILCNVAPSLSSILLSGNKFCSLPSCLHKFRSLRNLQLRNCKFLQKIPNLPRSTRMVDTTGCVSLRRSPDNIVDIISERQQVYGCRREFVLMNSGIPESLSYETASNSIRVSFQHNHNRNITLATSVTFRVDIGDSYQGMALVSCNIFIGCRLQSCYMRKFPTSTSEYTWLVEDFSTKQGTSLEENDWNDVIVCFEAVKCPEVVTIRRCGVYFNEKVSGIQNDVKGPGAIYTDFDQQDELLSRYSDVVIKSFAQELSAKSRYNCGDLLGLPKFLIETNSNMQAYNHVYHDIRFTPKRGMEGMAEITLSKSIWDKFVKDHNIRSEIVASNGSSASVRGYKNGNQLYLATHDRQHFQDYRKRFFDSYFDI